MQSHKLIARSLAAAFVAGPIDVESLVKRGAELLGKRWRWLRPLARKIVACHSAKTRPRVVLIEKMILTYAGFHRALYRGDDLYVANPLAIVPTMLPSPAAIGWEAPVEITTPGELAAWLGVRTNELDWFADLRGWNERSDTECLRHYRYRFLPKRSGRTRLIEIPKARLKTLQRKILTEILDRVPPHDAAHGFRSGRSIQTFAQPHVGKQVCVKLDLADFFPSIHLCQIQGWFRAIGFPEKVADRLGGICCTTTPGEVLAGESFETIRTYRRPHLAQGAPTSPALANLCAYRLDQRLTGLAEAVGATYSRYADDLVFSGDDAFCRVANRFPISVAAIAMEEGFAVQHRKTRVMKQGVAQRIAGLVVNQQLNLPRKSFETLKAILTNCIRHGPASQNRSGHPDFRAHLQGKISYVASIHPAKGERLMHLFDQIEWR
ncbi:reverse transcriptase family protein [Bremerella cremea]|uniref:reverse transcriptase family protein n=1 Tax=Bremerella cremea TaxID=1031537 RepID=UPI0031E74C62